MSTISEKLIELKKQKESLAENLNAKGVAAEVTEKFNSLVPKVLEIETGIDTTDGTATENDILLNKIAYVNNEKIVGTILSQEEQTIVPSTIDKTISSGIYIAGKQTIKGDENLVPENIKDGITIFEVDGSYKGSIEGLDTSDATATSADLVYGTSAYVNGEKIVGTNPNLIDTTELSNKTASSSNVQEGMVAFINGAKVVGIAKSIADEIYIPTDVDQIIQGPVICEGQKTFTIQGDENFIASNIKKGVTIWGVTGTYSSESSGSVYSQVLLDTTSFSSPEETLNTYGKTIYISETENTQFASLEQQNNRYGSIGTVNSYIAPEERKYGIQMDNWSTSNATENMMTFSTPITIQADTLAILITTYQSTWTSSDCNLCLVKASGNTIDEIMASIRQKIDAEDYVEYKALNISGGASGLAISTTFSSVDFGDYYLVLRGTIKASNGYFTYAKIEYLNY